MYGRTTGYIYILQGVNENRDGKPAALGVWTCKEDCEHYISGQHLKNECKAVPRQGPTVDGRQVNGRV